MTNENYLSHYGVKGMKWGVRRSPQQLGYRQYSAEKGDVTIPKGTKFQRITTASNTGYTKGVYTAYKNADKDLYKGVLGRMRVSQLAKQGEEVKINELTMTAKKDINLPSRKVRIDEFKKLYEEDKSAVSKLIKDHEKQRYDKDDDGNFDVNNPLSVEKAYKKFNDALAFGVSSENGNVIRQYYSNLSKKGYNAIPDENDIKLSTFKAQAPIILFDTSDSIGKTSIRELTPSEILNSYERSIGSKMVRDTLLPSGVGFERLAPDSISRSNESAREFLRDQYRLNENYTMQNLADDWANHRLSVAQIERINRAMDSGSTHQEAVENTMGFGNVVVDQILNQFEL